MSKLDYKNDLTFANKFQFNKWDYDFQILRWVNRSRLYTWSRLEWEVINNAGFTGELTYFGNKDNNIQTKQNLGSKHWINYMFANSVFVSADFLFNSDGKIGKAKSVNNIFNLDYSAKNLSPSKYSVFGSVTISNYPFNCYFHLPQFLTQQMVHSF